ncbi:MAG: glycine--tRNA ligase subunit beta [Planctomycetes bacterium]|nr:glycine--tRNA ligase subunit beta [Planctomycetota bacterium]
MPDLLIELGTEEVPASYLDRALPELQRIVTQGLTEVGLAPREVQVGGSPRRIALWAGDLPDRQPDVVEEKVGPSEQAAYKDGQPTTAALKFAESMGVAVAALEWREVTKGKKTTRYLYAARKVAGRPTLEVLAERLPGFIEAIPFKKSMRWVPGAKVRFARPVRRLTALLGAEVVPFTWAGVRSDRVVQGHRFLDPEPFALRDASWKAYVDRLREAHVLVVPAERRKAVEEGLRRHVPPEALAARQHLVDEVTNLVEWPLVDAGRFEERYLRLPAIVVEEAMTGHQRYFPIPDEGGERLQPRFAYVANRPFDPVIRGGNERVLAARLHDALFFFEQDQKVPLDQRVDKLDEIVFMQELGTYRARIDRIDHIALEVARVAGWVPPTTTTPGTGQKVTKAVGPGATLALHIHLAAQLARTDLTTDIVQEFPGLQGEMGSIYARLQGQPAAVADALREAYLPRSEGGPLPSSQVGICLSIADKLDTIACAWATGRKPTGSKDPFMVRRSVIGVLRILRERGLDGGYARLVRAAIAQLPDGIGGDRDALEAEVLDYFRARVEGLMVEADRERHAVDLVRAVLGSGADPSNVVDAWARLDALVQLAADPRFKRLFELVERTRNITAKSGEGVDPQDVDEASLEHPAEQALHAALAGCREQVTALVAQRRYVDAGALYAERLADVVHTFFEPAPRGVFVLDEDPRKRTNRLALLKQVHALLAAGFADLALVQKG